MSFWSMHRAQVEPTAALVAVMAVCVGVSLYAGILDGTIPGVDRDVAEPTLQRIHEAASDAGMIVPRRLRTATKRAAVGYPTNVTLAAGTRQWHVGPVPPQATAESDVAVAAQLTSIRLGGGRVIPGELRVAVWR